VFYWDPERRYYIYFCSEIGTLKKAKEIANSVNREDVETAAQVHGFKPNGHIVIMRRGNGRRLLANLFPRVSPWNLRTPDEDMKEAVRVFFNAKKKHDDSMDARIRGIEMLQRISSPIEEQHFQLFPSDTAIEDFLSKLWDVKPVCGQGQNPKTNDWEYDIPKPIFIYNLVDDGCVNEYLNVAKADVLVILRQLLEERDIPITERKSYEDGNTTSFDYFLDEDAVRVASYTYNGPYVGTGILWVNQLQLQPHINIQKESE
jgi:hypothetical protein